ncbi:MAG: hypothetical protein ABR577_05095 [Pyrinomonadaceae bacterium]
MKEFIVTFCIHLLLLGAPSFVYARRPALVTPIVGYYSDLKLLESEGMVTGNGSFIIRKVNGKYVATFTELMHDGGEYYPDFTVNNLTVNKFKGIIVFDLALHSGRDVTILRRVTGKVSGKGIKMNWRGTLPSMVVKTRL